jgi:multicomponent Na+:H+ antiporter subunit D
MEHIAILVVITPLFGAFSTPFVSLAGKKAADIWVGIFSGLTFVFSILLGLKVLRSGIVIYTLGAPEPAIATVDYNGLIFPVRILLEVDALSALLALVISLIGFFAAIYSWRYMEHDTGVEKFYTLFLLLLTGMLGIVLTGDIFNMYVFLEIMSISAYALVAFRKETFEAVEAGIKYLVVGSAASTLILLAVAILYGVYGSLTIAQIAHLIEVSPSPLIWGALALYLTGFILKAGIVPLHMWLIDAHPAAPSSISALLSGVVIKTGAYAIIRIFFTLYGVEVMNRALIGWIIVVIAVITMFVGGSLGLIQQDLKRLLAYSSVAQMGYIALGIGVALIAFNTTAGDAGLVGALFHLLNHAIMKGMLFLIAGVILHQLGTRNINEMGGLIKKMPITSACFIIGGLAIAGVPPFNGFVSKLILYEASAMISPALAVIAIISSALTLGMYLRVIQTAFLGRAPETLKDIRDPPASMLIPIVILAILIVIFGILPSLPVDSIITPAVEAVKNQASYLSAVLP